MKEYDVDCVDCFQMCPKEAIILVLPKLIIMRISSVVSAYQVDVLPTMLVG